MTLPVFTYRRRVAWGDVDASGAWRFVAALGYVEEAETALMRAIGILAEAATHLPRRYVQADFRGPARFDDEVDVNLRVSRVGRTSVHYAFTIMNGERLAVEGALGVVFTAGSGSAEELPESIRSAFTSSR